MVVSDHRAVTPPSRSVKGRTGPLGQASQVLGQTQEARGSELQAGARAELIPSALTWALSSVSGRAFAKMIIRVGAIKPLMNYGMFRPRGLMALIERGLPPEQPEPLIVDPAGGFSPMGFWLAERYPQAKLIEFDLPDIVTEKHRRLQRAPEVVIPSNLHFVPLDLGQITLSDAVESRPIDVLLLNATYTPHEATMQALRDLRATLSPNGAVVVTFPWMPGARQLPAFSKRLFTLQVGEIAGRVDDESTLIKLFTEAGYSRFELHFFSHLAAEMGHPIPVDIEVIVLARP